VLIVDDDPVTGSVLGDLVTALGCEAHWVACSSPISQLVNRASRGAGHWSGQAGDFDGGEADPRGGGVDGRLHRVICKLETLFPQRGDHRGMSIEHR
jgi:hypothetical protein